MNCLFPGISPKNSDWAVDECVAFNDLVQDKLLVSRVHDVNSDVSSNTWKVSLQVIDTSDPDVDTDIGEVLIKNSLAVRSDVQ
jgi:hypothetical protein